MVRRAICFDPLHDSPERRALPGWQDIVGYRLDRAGTVNDPPIKQQGVLCGACGSVRQSEILEDLTNRRNRRRAVMMKLKALGFADDEIAVMNLNLDD